MLGKIISQRKAGQIPYEIDQQDPNSDGKQLTLVGEMEAGMLDSLPLRIGAAVTELQLKVSHQSTPPLQVGQRYRGEPYYAHPLEALFPSKPRSSPKTLPKPPVGRNTAGATQAFSDASLLY